MQVIVPYNERPNPALLMPHMSLFPAELKYWRDAHDQAVKNGDRTVESVANRLTQEMRYASRQALQIRQFAERGAAINRDGVIDWYERTTKFLAWSRLWREMMADSMPSPETGTEKPSTVLWEGWEPDPSAEELPQIIVEQGDAEPQCGIQAAPRIFSRLFDVEPPEEAGTTWLEGQDVFVRTMSPAEPGLILAAKYQVRGDEFPAQAFITARPILKSAVWQSYIDM